MKEYIQILKYLGKYKKFAILLPVFIMLQVALEISIPYLVSGIIDKGIGNADYNHFLKIGTLMILASIGVIVFGCFTGRYAATAGTGLTRNLRDKLWSCVQEFACEDVERFGTPSLITRMTTDMNYIQNAFLMLQTMLQAPITIIFALIMAFKINSRLAIIYLFAVPVFAIIIYIISKIAQKHYQNLLKKYDKMNTSLQENLTGVRIVKSLVREDFETKKFCDASSEVRENAVKAERLTSLSNPILQFTVNVCIVILLWVGGINIISGDMTSGELFSYILYSNQILFQIVLISMILMPIINAQVSIQRVLEVINTEISITNKSGNKEHEIQDGSIYFHNVSFKYSKENENRILSDINMNINAGDHIAVIGATGSGKSTLVHLLIRMYDVTEGTLYIGGRDIKDYDINKLRNDISIVFQNNKIFSGTIRSNLVLGHKDISEKDLDTACKTAQAYDFIHASKDGYDYLLTQGGTNLSGGQRQRLCIARALARKPKIMVFDDSMSALDRATMAKVYSAISENYKDTTIIMITHRMELLEKANRIAIIEKGMLNGYGTHEELLEDNRIYREIYESQRK
jgi:ATP-binding cassette subfamily B protein